MGYIGNKMSERAMEAYDNGEMPLSKRTKEEILYAINSIRSDLDFSKLTKQELTIFLTRTSWHHTGKYFNATNFYSINEDYIREYNQEKIDNIIKNRAPRKKSEKKLKEPNLYIAALVKYTNREGTRKHPKKFSYQEIIQFRSEDKKVFTNVGRKLLSSVSILQKIEQKTKYASKDKLLKFNQNKYLIKENDRY